MNCNSKGIVVSQGMAFDGESYWLVENKTNWVAKLSMDLREAKYISEIPFYGRTDRRFSYIVGIIDDGNVYFTPGNINVLWKYNLTSGIFKSIELPIKDNRGLYIVSSWSNENSLWLCSYVGEVWEVSLKDDRVEACYDLFTGNSETKLSTEFSMQGDIIYGVDSAEGLLYHFNIVTHKSAVSDIGEEYGFGTVCVHGENVYLTDKSNSILLYNLRTGEKKRYTLFDANISSESNVFIRSTIYKDLIILIPWMPNGPTNNDVILFDIKKNESVVLKTRDEKRGFCILGGIYQDKLFYNYSNCEKLYVYDFKKKFLEAIDYTISNKVDRDSKLINGGIINEEMTMGLNDYIDALTMR